MRGLAARRLVEEVHVGPVLAGRHASPDLRGFPADALEGPSGLGAVLDAALLQRRAARAARLTPGASGALMDPALFTRVRARARACCASVGACLWMPSVHVCAPACALGLACRARVRPVGARACAGACAFVLVRAFLSGSACCACVCVCQPVCLGACTRLRPACVRERVHALFCVCVLARAWVRVRLV